MIVMNTAWKMFVFRVFLVLALLNSVQIWKNTDKKNFEYRHIYSVELIEIANDHSNVQKSYQCLLILKWQMAFLIEDQ